MVLDPVDHDAPAAGGRHEPAEEEAKAATPSEVIETARRRVISIPQRWPVGSATTIVSSTSAKVRQGQERPPYNAPSMAASCSSLMLDDPQNTKLEVTRPVTVDR